MALATQTTWTTLEVMLNVKIYLMVAGIPVSALVVQVAVLVALVVTALQTGLQILNLNQDLEKATQVSFMAAAAAVPKPEP